MAAVLKYWTGSAWIAKPLKYWTGSAWATKQLKYWNGSAWIGAGAAAPPYQDNFDRADNLALEATPVASGGWSWVHDGVTAGAMGILSGQARGYTASTTHSAYTAATLSSADQYVQFTVPQIAGGPGSFCALRMTDANNCIAFRSRVTNIEVYRVVAAAFTSIYTGTGLSALNAVLRLVVQGGNFTVYKDGALLSGPTAIGGTFSGMKAGIVARSAAGQMGDNFECGPLVVYADSFDRANANLEASLVASGGWSWTHDGVIAAGFTIASNALKSNTALTTGSAYKAPALFSADQYVSYKVTNITAATGPFACCRLADASNFVGIRTGNGGSNGQIEVYRRSAGSLSSIYTSAASAVALNDIIRLEVSGSTFTVKKNGTVVTGPTAIGGTFAATTPGLVARSSTTMTFEDFEAGTL